MKPDNATADKDSIKQNDTADAGQAPIAPDNHHNDPEELKKNRDRLGVDEGHKTPDMKKHRRGTFP